MYQGSPICVLPMEILTRVFLLVQIEDKADTLMWTSVLQVCKLWYSAAVADPVLWSRINLDQKGWNTWLERSKSVAPLIVCSSKTPGANIFLDHLAAHLHRIGECRLVAPDIPQLYRLLSLLESPSSVMLQALDLTWSDVWPYPITSNIEFRIPTLRRLYLTDVYYKWTTQSLSQLTHLSIMNYMQTEDILEFLRSSERLQWLEMKAPLCDVSGPCPSTTIILLPHLQHLVLVNDRLPPCNHFSTHLALPSSAYIEMRSMETEYPSTYPKDLEDVVSFMRNTPTQEFKLVVEWNRKGVIVIVDDLDKPPHRLRCIQVASVRAEGRWIDETVFLPDVFDDAFGSFEQLTHIELILDNNSYVPEERILDNNAYVLDESGPGWTKTLRNMGRVTWLKLRTLAAMKVTTWEWERPLNLRPLLRALLVCEETPVLDGDRTVRMLLPRLHTLILEGFCSNIDSDFSEELEATLRARRSAGCAFRTLDIGICAGDGGVVRNMDDLQSLVEVLHYREVDCLHREQPRVPWYSI